MIEIIPAMDLIGGKCVRLTQGDFASEKVYSDDPLEVAKRFEAAGLRRLHMVDLDGARTGSPANLHVLKHVASLTTLSIDYGGGLKSESDVKAAFDAGASMINVGSLAVREPTTLVMWLDKFGNDRIILGADARDGKISIDGWMTDTDIPVVEFLAEKADDGVIKAFVTDVASDGTMAGPALQLYRRIISEVPRISLIASGGVRSVSDIDELESLGCVGVIIGKALYEESIQLEDLAHYVS